MRILCKSNFTPNHLFSWCIFNVKIAADPIQLHTPNIWWVVACEPNPQFECIINNILLSDRDWWQYKTSLIFLSTLYLWSTTVSSGWVLAENCLAKVIMKCGTRCFLSIQKRLTTLQTYTGCGLKQEAADIPVDSLVKQTSPYNNLTQLNKRLCYLKLSWLVQTLYLNINKYSSTTHRRISIYTFFSTSWRIEH